MKGKRLLDSDPTALSDNDLDIQIGALTEELENLDSEISKVERVRADLLSRRAQLLGRSDIAKARRENRGQGQGRGNGNP